MTEHAVRKLDNNIPESAPEQFRAKIIEHRKRLRSKVKPAVIPVVTAQSADAAAIEERERHTLQGALAAAVITLL